MGSSPVQSAMAIVSNTYTLREEGREGEKERKRKKRKREISLFDSNYYGFMDLMIIFIMKKADIK